jgi:hypothetical protein
MSHTDVIVKGSPVQARCTVFVLHRMPFNDLRWGALMMVGQLVECLFECALVAISASLQADSRPVNWLVAH